LLKPFRTSQCRQQSHGAKVLAELDATTLAAVAHDVFIHSS